jgi:uncharacterized membrane protein (UPF0136 family)
MIRLLVSFLTFIGGIVASTVWLHTNGQASLILGMIAGCLVFAIRS